MLVLQYNGLIRVSRGDIKAQPHQVVRMSFNLCDNQYTVIRYKLPKQHMVLSHIGMKLTAKDARSTVPSPVQGTPSMLRGLLMLCMLCVLL